MSKQDTKHTTRMVTKMTACRPITYCNVTYDVFECMKKKFGRAGINVPEGNSGDMEGSGVRAHFEWDGVSNLTITVKEKPFVVSCGFITGKMTAFVHKCIGN